MGLEEFLPWGIGGAAAKRLAGDSGLELVATWSVARAVSSGSEA